jgi:two-component system response regulator YesN
MYRSWFYRMLFSYLPIFLFSISFLFFVFFQILNERSRQDTVKASEALNAQVIQLIDYSLKSVDYLLLNELAKNNDILQYFERREKPEVYLTYQIIEGFRKLKQVNSLIDSIYLVRASDRWVLSENTTAAVDKFADRSFIYSVLEDTSGYNWSTRRA